MSENLPTENAPPETMTNEEGSAAIKGWLNQRLRITITDSRSFEGWFKCIDRDCNIVLANTEEFHDGTISLTLNFLMFCRKTAKNWIDSDTRTTCVESGNSFCTQQHEAIIQMRISTKTQVKQQTLNSHKQTL